MEKMRHLTDLDEKQIRNFLDSFDTVITDCDGVLWLGDTEIEGSLKTLKKLQAMGKKILFVSNNCTITLEKYGEKFRTLGYTANPDQIIIPSKVIAWYLKKLGFEGNVFAAGTKAFRSVLKAEGIQIVDSCVSILDLVSSYAVLLKQKKIEVKKCTKIAYKNGSTSNYIPNDVEESVPTILKELQSYPDVEAVIVDLDMNFNWIKVVKSIKYLMNQDVLYISGGIDRRIPVAKDRTILGAGAFVDIISTETKREPVSCAKPSVVMKNYVIERCEIDDPSRCIFIGDSLENDMQFANICGFRKLWVGSGIDTLESLENHGFVKDDAFSVPDYYLPRLGQLLDILSS